MRLAHEKRRAIIKTSKMWKVASQLCACSSVRSAAIDVEFESTRVSGDEELSEAKAALLASIEGTSRGFGASREQMTRVREAISRLERTARESDAPRQNLGGAWTLAWTDAPDILSRVMPALKLGALRGKGKGSSSSSS